MVMSRFVTGVFSGRVNLDTPPVSSLKSAASPAKFESVFAVMS